MAQSYIPFSQKWELHKPLLERLYLDENFKLPKIQKVMREEQDFDAEIYQYKYQFKKWNLKKSISSAKKDALLEIGDKRTRQGHGTVITRQGRPVDTKKLLRHAKMKGKQDAVVFSQAQSNSSTPYSLANPLLGNRHAFYMWNLPYNALLQYLPRQVDHHSPYSTVSIPSDVDVASPSGNTMPSPGFSRAVSLKASRQRADFFVSGKFDELLRLLNRTEKKTFSTWLYQFWYFGFKTAKHWGQGLHTWTASELWSRDLPLVVESSNASSPAAHSPMAGKRPMGLVPEPTPLCRWSIHIGVGTTVGWLDDDSQVPSQVTAHENWPEALCNTPFESKLQESLENNSFSTLDVADLPVHAGQIAIAAKRSPDEIFKQCLGFAIMGRNVLLVDQLLYRAVDEKRDIADLFPFHLATTFLDGAKSCCQILRLLQTYDSLDLRPNTIGQTGYTPLDNLMISILRNHSSTLPETVDGNLRGAKRFGGEDVDVCGRWDADSECYRLLLSSGSGTIPPNWKHKFCHTSIQAVCHAMHALSLEAYGCPLSGIFVKYCFTCGMKLQLPPLHAMVLTAFHLAKSGAEDEDLFGMICCILGFIVFSRSIANIKLERSHVSIDLLLEDHSSPLCTHEELSATEFAIRLTLVAQDCMPAKAKSGWMAISEILRQLEDQYVWSVTGVPPAGYEDQHKAYFAADKVDQDEEYQGEEYQDEVYQGEECDVVNRIWWDEDLGSVPCRHMEAEIPRAFGRNRLLGHIWAACQCELLTYRRLREDDIWTSSRLDVSMLLKALESGNEDGIAFVEQALMKEYCVCGMFGGKWQPCLREDACWQYYSNLDIWDRTTFLDDAVVDY